MRDQRCVVHQPVDGSGDAGCAREHAVPLGEAEAGGDHRRASPVASRDDGVEDVGVPALELHVADFVEQQQAGPGEDRRGAAAARPCRRSRRGCRAGPVPSRSGTVWPCRSAWCAALAAIMVFPVPCPPTSTALSARPTKPRPISASTSARLMSRGHVQSKSAIGLKAGSRASARRRSWLRAMRARFLAVDQLLDPAGAGDLVPSARPGPVQAERPGALPELAHVPSPSRFAGLS